MISDSSEFEVHAMEDSSDSGSSSEGENREVEEIDLGKYGRLKLSIEEPPELDLKPLPNNLDYVFFEEGSKLPVIIASDLIVEQKDKLLSVLKKYKREIAWKITDIRGISTYFCTHKILMEDNHMPTLIPQ